jgi:SMI1-KNR4 cell-wall
MKEEEQLLLITAPPPSSAVNPGAPDGWHAVERQLGRELPDDYKWLINTYGSGDFCDVLVVLNPFAPQGWMNILSQLGPISERYQFGGPFNRAFPCFPEVGGLLPLAQVTSGGYLFWLTRGRPDEWQLVLFDYDDYELYPMGLVKFLAQWIAGRMPESFFGTGNDPGLIRHDPVFRPCGQIRPARHPA